MNEPLADFPNSTPAPESKPGYALGSDDAVRDVMQRLEAKRAERGDTSTMTPAQVEYKARMQRAADFHAAKAKAERDDARSQLADYAAKANESPYRNLHEAAFADAPKADRIESDFDASGFASSLGFDPTALGTTKFENAEAARAETKAALDDILSQVSDDELLAVIESEPAAVDQLRAEIEREIDALASKEFGYRGKRTAEQANAVDVVTTNAIRQLAAHHKLKAPAPSVSALIARSRLAVEDNFRPGRRGEKREFAEPADLPRTIHHLLMANEF